MNGGRVTGKGAVIALALGALAFTGVSAVLSAPRRSNASPGSVEDQAYPLHAAECAFNGWALDDSTSIAAQTFTAGISGALTDVVMALAGTNQNIKVSITGVDATGAPTVATPLTSTSLNPAPYPVRPATDVTISFSSPARVTAGQQYAIVLTSPTETVDNNVGWAGDVGKQQTINPTCPLGTYAGGRAWTLNGTAPLGSDADFFFHTFVLPARKVTVQKIGTGGGTVTDSSGSLNCGTTCTVDILTGQNATLTATPDATSIFSGWSGGCTGTAPTCPLTVTGDTTVTASFSKRIAALSVKKVGSGRVTSSPAGIACGTRCSGRFPVGTITLAAKPTIGWKFSRWAGACRGTKPICRFSLNRVSTVTATFMKR
jgi:uncharacterized repeat protein (TIGR02543 family)